MTNDIQAKILARVRKLMKLASDAGATEGERDNAMRMAHATLAKYNLSMSQVGAGESEEKRGQYSKEFLGKPWCISIAAAISRMYFCHYYYQGVGGNAGPSQKAIHVFIGRESNVITAQEMAQFIVESVNREAQRYQRGIGGTYADYRAFAQGAMIKIRQRCDDIVEKSKKEGVPDEAQPGTALVLASLYQTEEDANKAYLKQLDIKLRDGRSQSFDMRKRAAMANGAVYGSQVSLNRQVGGAAPSSSPRLERKS